MGRGVAAAPLLRVAVADLPAFLTGRWTLERTIDDRRAGRRGRASGEARFEPLDAGAGASGVGASGVGASGAASGGLRWIEHGTVQIGDFAGEFSRELAIVPDGDAWLVRFDDGRPFHPLDLREGRCLVDHPCGADAYAGALRAFETPAGPAGPAGPELEVDWRVTGPAKDQRIVTRYRRA
ncbi:DUF6314 family protein [Conexibacter woesei]|uniref:DUF6314 domain-containing protein n=1 Tax=Conexibacter woesei (strain DSM 14684 / CCUG 47730 / CIP 108061 / JCM 11494 / NBRC 100937 / ID131577) TaxID=469383 RepID=D3F8G7_CONWI|nr:DUF6314 family protein [Conexibacter woesei]ADB50931.1 hypothetical protein Cwoe_2509 [Conexibacter woesei DSM 14684]